MKRIYALFILIASAFIFSFETKESKVDMKSDPISVVELFTSQGCSSCPSADKNLSSVADQKNIFALSFHVSYWNYLGWKDPYSSELYTNRQRLYGVKFNLRSIYTPQMIVNGKEEFVGSSASKLDRAIISYNREPISITVSDIDIVDDNINLQYELKEQPTELKLNVAVVERHVKNYVPRGENHGRTLAHDNVVRSFFTVDANVRGTLKIEIPEFSSEERLVILYLQHEESMEIMGASKITF